MASSLTAYDPNLHKNALSSPPKLVPFDEVLGIITKILSTEEGVKSILDNQLEAFQMSSSSSSSKCASLPIQTAGQPPYATLAAGPQAQVCIKTGYASGDTVMVSKCAAGGGKHSGNTGSVSVYDQKTLRLKAVLCDEGLLTEIRTAAAAAVATRAAILAAGTRVQKMGVIGGGVQAIWQLRLLAASKIINPNESRVVIKTSSRASAEKFIQTMKESPHEPDRQWTLMEPYDDNSKFHGCQVIHSVTPARSPVLDVGDVDLPKAGNNPFLHISAIGSDSPGKCELALDLLKLADVSLVDSLLQTVERGEFQNSRCEGFKFPLKELGEPGVVDSATGKLAVDRGAAAKSQALFTIFDSSGMAMQDVQMAKLVAQNL
ncbi:Putative dehydrogenase [Seminavis robusta]|uniref:Dehydrogenase n=1 Tax=Seminavis robusta TaxID=568900 RepID=A0A9N8DEH2_9STRA|nr:Putative dehydrogenase [Seminavis robusta]|eukprot:Sro50_g029280.1 Putative dehydrogenase (375) ;mRNA; r:133663-134989